MVCNQIQGTLPSNLGAVFPSLESFGISRNKFSGTIPVSLANASNLVRLQMAEKKLHGQVPSLRNLPRLEKLLSACSGSDYSDHDFKALIYVFMVNSWRNGCIQLKQSVRRIEGQRV